MKRPAFLLFGLLACALAVGAERSGAQRGAFVRENPCPATGERRGACPGYVVDHIRPLCDGGLDHSGNMQWQTVQDISLYTSP